MKPMKKGFAAALLASLVLVVACNKGPTPMRVWGSVTFEGKALPEGAITFIPISPHTGPSTGGTITGGKYDIAANVGPFAGSEYRVEITATRASGKMIPNTIGHGGGMLNVPEMYIPERYNANSTLRASISPEADKNQFDFTLVPGP
ncbi:MAG: hypothetical protein U0792_13595 [Gemmataceae bacterium]